MHARRREKSASFRGRRGRRDGHRRAAEREAASRENRDHTFVARPLGFMNPLVQTRRIRSGEREEKSRRGEQGDQTAPGGRMTSKDAEAHGERKSVRRGAERKRQVEPPDKARANERQAVNIRPAQTARKLKGRVAATDPLVGKQKPRENSRANMWQTKAKKEIGDQSVATERAKRSSATNLGGTSERMPSDFLALHAAPGAWRSPRVNDGSLPPVPRPARLRDHPALARCAPSGGRIPNSAATFAALRPLARNSESASCLYPFV